MSKRLIRICSNTNEKVMVYRSTQLRNMSRIMTHDLEFATVTFGLGTL